MLHLKHRPLQDIVVVLLCQLLPTRQLTWNVLKNQCSVYQAVINYHSRQWLSVYVSDVSVFKIWIWSDVCRCRLVFAWCVCAFLLHCCFVIRALIRFHELAYI